MSNTATSVVIVGATSLIATECARLWATNGATRLRLIGRNAEALERVAQDLRIRGLGQQAVVDIVTLDLTDPLQITAALAAAQDEMQPDTILIAHGVMHDATAMHTNLELAHEQLEVTGVSPVLWLEGAICATAAKRIAVIGSVAGDRGRASNYLYGSSKGMVERAAEGMSHRLYGTGRTVTLIKPGPTATPMTAHLQAQGAKLASAAQIATDIVRAISAGKQVLYAPGIWRWIMLVVRSLPKFVFHRTSL